MKNTLEVQAAEALPKQIGDLVLAFQAKCASLAAGQVQITNDAREIGLLVQSWTGHEQMTLGFFVQHQRELPNQITFEMLKTFIAIARRVPEEVTQLTDARRVWQLDFMAAGLLSLPQRTKQQARSTTTKFMDFVNRIGAVRHVLVDWNRDEPFETWNAETREAVKAQLRPLAEFYESL